MSDIPDNPYSQGQILLIDKPYGETSFAAVRQIRYLIKKRYNLRKIKVGHAGTLDPLATGLLIICTGRKTKEISGFQELKKEYTGIITLGATTPSYDLETEVDQEFSLDDLNEEKIKATAKTFIGEQLQIPPTFSAKWVNGKRAYEYARSGEEVEMCKALINIYEFEITGIELPHVEFRILCSKGTYIRAIARDFGLTLNNGGHLTTLRRTKIGDYQIRKATSIDEFKNTLNVLN